MRVQTSILICGALLCLPLFAKSNAPTKLASDQEFLQTAAESDMLHAHLGQMAEKNSTKRGIRDLGQEISQNDQADYRALGALAEKIGATIPKGIDEQGNRTIDRLSRLRGSSFDHAFIQEIINSDKKTLADFEHEAQHAQNPDVKAYASNALSALKLHLYEAQDWVKYGDDKK
jgi:predicted outer membrane protein